MRLIIFQGCFMVRILDFSKINWYAITLVFSSLTFSFFPFAFFFLLYFSLPSAGDQWAIQILQRSLLCSHSLDARRQCYSYAVSQWIWYDKAKQSKAKQSKTKQNKTKQTNQTKQKSKLQRKYFIKLLTLF